MSETPTQRADRADRMLERCRNRGTVRLSHLEGLRNDLRAVANGYDDLTKPGTGRKDVLEDILEHWDTHVTDEVDNNPERNPHVGFVPAEKSGLVDALMEWRGGDLNDYVDPFAVHTVTVECVAGWSEHSTIPKATVRHPVDCDRLPYGELCAFDKVCDASESLCLPKDCAPGEYEAWIQRGDTMSGAGEEYIEIGKPVVRES